MVRAGYEIGDRNKYHFLHLDNLSEEISELPLRSISLSPTVKINENFLVYANSNNPLVHMDNVFYRETLGIDEDYYLEHKDKIDDEIIKIIENSTGYLWIRDVKLITPRVIDALVSNSKLTTIRLGMENEPFTLTEELYKLFKDSGKNEVYTDSVVDSLKENFDSIIGYNNNRYLFNSSTYKDLQRSDTFYLTRVDDENQIENLKYLNPEREVRIDFKAYGDPVRIINVLNSVNPNRKIIISIEDKNEFNAYLFKRVNEFPSNVKIYWKATEIDYKEYLSYEKRLTELVLPVMNLSPYLQYLYIYDIVNKYKKYKENEDDKNSARDLYRLLDNDYMVCVGYAKLLVDLLSKVGITAYEMSVSVDIGLDNVPLDTLVLPDFVAGSTKDEIHEVKTESAGHARVMVDLVDPNYGIDGFYIADPTWDNVMDEHAFNYALMTQDEYVATDRYNYFNRYGVSELFFVHSIEEFYAKVNLLLDMGKNRDEKDVRRSLSEYGIISDSEDVGIAFMEIGEQILGKVNKGITPDIYRVGITELYRLGLLKCMDDRTIDEEVDHVMSYNSKRHNKCFPMRYVILKDGTKRPLFNISNKFGNDDLDVDVKETDMVRK